MTWKAIRYYPCGFKNCRDFQVKDNTFYAFVILCPSLLSIAIRLKELLQNYEKRCY